MHHDEARHDALPRAVDHRGACRRGDSGRVADRGDVAVAHDDRLVLTRRRTRAVDHAHVGQRNHRRLHLDVRRQRIRGLLRDGRPKGLHDEDKTENGCKACQTTHLPHRPSVPIPPILPILPIPP